LVTFWFTKDLVDKALNIGFVIAEVALALFLFRLPFYFPQNYTAYFASGLLVVLAIFLHFYLSFFLSLSAFWTDDIWAVRWLFGVVFLEFFAGTFFPIDILPTFLQKIIYLTPFPYLIYFPVKNLVRTTALFGGHEGDCSLFGLGDFLFWLKQLDVEKRSEKLWSLWRLN